MKRIGMRELNQNAARVIGLVAHGETIEVTRRGRPVARVVPVVDDGDVLTRLVREGQATAPTRARGPIPLPPRFGDEGVTASDEVIAARARERW
ncbi:MAG: type II toxin-antitoxin system prevent-host-death family antitoxin [Candidatus Dormibacteraeota bacterium]|uniref:Antitoxin n=1 Tax=Candidatus Amunia macphersoniae TaxID=3127014 RepID=A0A934KJW6_9BACT|nr:type II toxin-antitoxin system prevent-host-death family antitoxin [Candidatus Dormibacteraeota bacterium]